MLVNWAGASPRNQFWTGLFPNLQVQDWRKFIFCKQVDSYSFRKFISARILCMSFYGTLVLFWGVWGLVFFVLFFLLTKNSGKNNAPSKTTLKWQCVWTTWKLLNQFYSSSLKLYHCRNFESHVWQCSSRPVKTQDYCYLAGVECSVCIKLVYIAMSNLSVAEEFTSTKINKYSTQLLNTMQKKNQKPKRFWEEAADFQFVKKNQKQQKKNPPSYESFRTQLHLLYLLQRLGRLQSLSKNHELQAQLQHSRP